MSYFIRTVLGDIEPRKLGWCQCHEHIFLKKGKALEMSKALCMDDFEKSVQELMDYRNCGGVSLVDAQPTYSGRIAENLIEASLQTKVNIIASTGFHKHAFYYEDSPIFTMSEEKLTELFISEIADGMLRTDGDRAKGCAGIIKVAVDRGGIGATKNYEKLFNAAIQASRETGAEILAHFEPDTDVFQLLRKMEQAHLPAGRLIACHLDRARIDEQYHKEVAKAGAFLEYDTINRLKYVSDENEIRLILKMLESGVEDRLLLSLDTTNERLRAYGGNMGLDYILTDFSMMLKNHGVREETLKKIMISNAAKALSIECKE